MNSEDMLRMGMFGVALPALVSAVVLLLAWRPWKQDSATEFWRGDWGGALALGAGFTAAHIGLTGKWLPSPSADAYHWLFYFAIVGLGAGVLCARASDPRWKVWILRIAVCAGAVWLLVSPYGRPREWGMKEYLLWVGVLSAMFIFFWWLMDATGRRMAGMSISVMMAMVIGCASVALSYSWSLVMGQLGGALAAAVGVSAVAIFFRPEASLAASGIPSVTLLFLGLLLCGFLYSGLPMMSAMFLMMAPAAAWVGLAPPVMRRGALVANLTALGVAALLCGAAILLAI